MDTTERARNDKIMKINIFDVNLQMFCIIIVFTNIQVFTSFLLFFYYSCKIRELLSASKMNKTKNLCYTISSTNTKKTFSIYFNHNALFFAVSLF